MPLTLIVGANGSGKTTIIEALKFIISGDEPPLSDSRRNFLHTPKDSSCGLNKLGASIELDFVSYRNEQCIARRDITRLGQTKGATPSISSSYKVAKKPWTTIHKQDDWNKTIPHLFSIPNQAILNNVVLCHQEDNLWCMGDSSTVKQIFDRIFGCERYKKEIKHIDAEIKTCKTDLAILEKDLLREGDKLKRMSTLREELASLRHEIDKLNSESNELDGRILFSTQSKDILKKQVAEFESKTRELEFLKKRIQELSLEESKIRDTLQNPEIKIEQMSDERLEAELQNYRTQVNQVKVRQSEFTRKEDLIKSELRQLEAKVAAVQDTINKLKVIEMKSKESLENVTKSLEKIKDEQSLDSLNPGDLQECLEALERYEQSLVENKCAQSELEEELSSKQQSLSVEIPKCESSFQSLFHNIGSRKSHVDLLTNQLAKTDPMAKDLGLLSENLRRMSLVAKDLPNSEPKSSLVDLIQRSTKTVIGLLKQVQNETVNRLSNEISKENEQIELNKIKLEDLERRRKSFAAEKIQLEEEYSKVRASSKDAHNRMVIFKNARHTLLLAYEKYKEERRLLETTNIEEKRKEISQLNDMIETKRVELTSLCQERTRLSDDLGRSLERDEEYRKNSQLRSVLKQVHDLSAKLTDISHCTLSHEQLEDVKNKLDNLERESLDLRDRRSTIAGSKQRMAREINKAEYELDCYSKTSSNYATILGKVVCNKIVMSDLEKLKECFSTSIISFHDQMIIKINEVLKARWRQIYRGSDIDLIELVDEEVVKGKDKKVVNYFIAMRKKGVRMKMREKSSAGQKALASIILRMVLAELFVKDFAFIALDEPTSNLDAANVLSLARAIASYVKRRMTKGLNIQWIIITHDEHFLRALDAECSPFFYRIQLDNEGYSTIAKISYQEFQDSQSWPLDE